MFYAAIYSALVCTKGFDTLIMFLFNPGRQFASESSHLNVSESLRVSDVINSIVGILCEYIRIIITLNSNR